ncbi:MAG: LptF/LptG family permease [Candidatus Kapabacteria bacterium]|nr:LptF/LptG family permease [Ignavibacteriota bacterium]MCW5884647.1 LptF/LptG family permease [Candidatus Kapabacteria bacterium]
MLRLIDRYILRIHFAPFIFGTGTVIFILLMQFLMISLGELVGKGLSEWLILKLIVFNMAWMVILAVPMGVLFSTLMSFGSMGMAHEVTIVKASGGSILRMMIPVITGSVFLYLALFYFNDIILPESNLQVKIMMNDIQRKKPTFALESGLFSTQLDGYTILARNVDSLSGSLSGVTIYDMTKFQSRNIISSDSGWISFTPDYKKLVLDLKEGEIHQFSVNNVDDYKIIRFSDYRIAMNAYGFSFEQSRADMVSKGDREMNVIDMNEIVSTADSNKALILARVDSVIKKNIDDLINGKPELKIDTTYYDEKDDIIVVSDKLESEIDNSTKQEHKKVIQKVVAENNIGKAKKDTAPEKTYAEKVREKFNRAVSSGNTDLNPDTIYSDATKEELSKKIEIEREKIISDSIKEVLVKSALEKQSKLVKDSKKSTKINQKAIKEKHIEPDIVIPNYVQSQDTAYNEVLSRVVQNVNIMKSSIQADVNNTTFFEKRARQYKVEIYKKYALPFACVIFVLVGAPLGIITKGGNFGVSAGISLLFYVFYWACLIGGEKLGDRGIIAPWLAMWMANIILGAIGLLLTLKVNYETFDLKYILSLFNKK